MIEPYAGGSLTCSDPDTCQCICIHLVALYETLSLLMNINAPMLPIVDLVVPHDGIAIGTYLDARQCVTCEGEQPSIGHNDSNFCKMPYYHCYCFADIVAQTSRQLCVVVTGDFGPS
ncbi:hypothetical protein E2C01_020465 [Portunus trituberculatus]|uniref:Uncharacterized protein n=1 Tax=Portunus trituberculatus TaxID=210409 RepID=A0A5B7E1S2_PORTR|nr:hypothetical protein [Portunus trituberculatus]